MLRNSILNAAILPLGIFNYKRPETKRVRAYYHAGCIDGIVASLQSPVRDAREWRHKKPPAIEEFDDMKGGEVHFYDVCPEPEYITQLAENTNILIIDHHKDAVSRAPIMRNVRIVYGEDSAAILSHKYFKSGPVPAFLRHISNNDTYKEVRESDLLILYLKVNGKVTREELLNFSPSDEETAAYIKQAEDLDAQLTLAAKTRASGILPVRLRSGGETHIVAFTTFSKEYEVNYFVREIMAAHPEIQLVFLTDENVTSPDVLEIKMRGDRNRPELRANANTIIKGTDGMFGGGHDTSAVGKVRLAKGEEVGDPVRFFDLIL